MCKHTLVNLGHDGRRYEVVERVGGELQVAGTGIQKLPERGLGAGRPDFGLRKAGQGLANPSLAWAGDDHVGTPRPLVTNGHFTCSYPAPVQHPRPHFASAVPQPYLYNTLDLPAVTLSLVSALPGIPPACPAFGPNNST